MPTSVRLDPETEALLGRLARSRGQTKSAVLRAALLRLAQDQPIAEAGDGPYALIADLMGIAQGGPDNLARRHKQAFRDMKSRLLW
jgi:hypothetical protein